MASGPIERIAIVGFGEAGGILGEELASRGLTVSTFDILFQAGEAREAMLAKTRKAKVRASENLGDCVAGAELVISTVTASSALEVAKEASRLLGAGQFFLDFNSVSPGTKQEMAGYFEKSQACFVEAAVMAAVPPQRLKVPLLLGGTYAAELAPRLSSIGMSASVASDRIGIASAVKMCRSVVIKGLEALAVESMFAARRHGAEDAVLASLAATFPEMGWNDSTEDKTLTASPTDSFFQAANRLLEPPGAVECGAQGVQVHGLVRVRCPVDGQFGQVDRRLAVGEGIRG